MSEDFVPWYLLFLSGSGAKVIGAHRIFLKVTQLEHVPHAHTDLSSLEGEKGSQELLRVDYHLLQAQEG